MDRTADLAGNSTFYEYHATGAGAGQLKKVTHADGAFTSYGYDLHGRVTEQSGSADHPARYTYDVTNGWRFLMQAIVSRGTAQQGGGHHRQGPGLPMRGSGARASDRSCPS